MIPNTGMTQAEFDEIINKLEKKKYSNKDYKLSEDGTRIVGFVDDLEEIKQTIYLILSTERYEYQTMSDNTGVELWDKYGEDIRLIDLKVANTIVDALLADDRITEVNGVDLKRVDRGVYATTQNVKTVIGDITSESEVRLNNEL